MYNVKHPIPPLTQWKCELSHHISSSFPCVPPLISSIMHNVRTLKSQNDTLNRPLDLNTLDSCLWNDKCDYVDLDHCTNLNINNYNLITMQWNIRSLLAHQYELKQLLRNLEVKRSRVDIVFFCETFLSKKTKKLVHIPGYKLVCNHHPTRKGGGVCILINENTPYKRRQDLDVFVEKTL